MDIVIRTLVLLTVTTKVIAFNFDGFMKNLHADLKAVILDMQQKQQEFSATGKDDVTSVDFKTGTPFVARKPNEMIKPTSTVMPKVATKINKPAIRMNKLVAKMNKPVTQRNRLLTTSAPLKPPPCILKTTEKSPEKPSTSQPPFLAMPMPMGMHLYSSIPIVLPMRTYSKKVEHDHPPLYKIKQIIEEDNRKEEEIERDISVVIEDSDVSTDQSEETDTDTNFDTSDSEYTVAGIDYYDDAIRINVNVRGRHR